MSDLDSPNLSFLGAIFILNEVRTRLLFT